MSKTSSTEGDDLRLLWAYLSNCCFKSHGLRFWLIIDAFDELREGSQQGLLRGIERLILDDITGRLRVFISARHLPDPASRFVTVLGPISISMENEDAQSDIKRFIRIEIATLCEQGPVARALRQGIEEAVLGQTHTTFLRATLAWTSFAKLVESWSPVQAMQRLTSSMLHRTVLNLAIAKYCVRFPRSSKRRSRSLLCGSLTARGS